MGWWFSMTERRKWLHLAVLIAMVCHVFTPHCVEHGPAGQLGSICQSGVDKHALVGNAVLRYFEEIAVKSQLLPDHGCDCAQHASITLPDYQPLGHALLLVDGKGVTPDRPPERLGVQPEHVRPLPNAPPLLLS